MDSIQMMRAPRLDADHGHRKESRRRNAPSAQFTVEDERRSGKERRGLKLDVLSPAQLEARSKGGKATKGQRNKMGRRGTERNTSDRRQIRGGSVDPENRGRRKSFTPFSDRPPGRSPNKRLTMTNVVRGRRTKR